MLYFWWDIIVMFTQVSNLFLDFLLNILDLHFNGVVWRRLNDKGNLLATFSISVICFDKVRLQISFWSHDVTQKIFKTQRKKTSKHFFSTQDRIINTRIRIKTFEIPIVCSVKWTVQYKQSTFEFLIDTINQKVSNF